MGNHNCTCGHCYDNGFGFDFDLGNYGPNYRAWKPVSDRAQNNLEIAKEKLIEYIKTYSFHNITGNETLTKQVINMHIVSKLRPTFNKFAKKIGAKSKWIKLTNEHKN